MSRPLSLEGNNSSASQQISRILWNPKIHLLFSQKLDICSYPKPDQSSPRPILLLESILISSFHLSLDIASGLIPLGFLTKTLYSPFLSPYFAHSQPIS